MVLPITACRIGLTETEAFSAMKEYLWRYDIAPRTAAQREILGDEIAELDWKKGTTVVIPANMNVNYSKSAWR